ncbi:TonB-system energizer ExbB [Galenea microaerophila]
MELLREYLDPIIFSTLGLMGFITLWLSIERLLFFKQLDLSQYTQPELLTIDLTRHLTTIASMGANAPYVGLLGTILGILITFYDLSHSAHLNSGAIMLGLALALKATAGGILVAIPSIMSYNALMRKVEVLQLKFQAQTHS